MATRYVWDRYNAANAISLGTTTEHQGSSTTVIANLYDYNGDLIDVSAGTTIYWALYSTRQLINNSNGTSYATLSTIANKGSIVVQSVIGQLNPLISGSTSVDQFLVFYRTDNFPTTINAYSYGMRAKNSGSWYATVVKQDTDDVTKIAGSYFKWTSPTTMIVKGQAAGTASSANQNAYPADAAVETYWYVSKGSDNITPSNVSIPEIIYGGESILITVTPRNGAFGGTRSYLYEISTNGGSVWSSVGVSTAATMSYLVPVGTGTIMARVRVQDNYGFTDTEYVQSSQVTVINNAAPSAPSSITVPETIQDTQTITITWGASSDPDGNLESYVLEVQINNGNWTQIYTGANLSYQHAMMENYNTVRYRVKAVDTYGYESGYTTSEERTLIHNLAPTAPGNLEVTEVAVGENVTITWTASTDSDGTIASYTVERSINESDYVAIYTGNALTFTEEVSDEWATVSYRVKATDNEGADSPYTESQTYTVQSGMLYISGPANNMGSINNAFDFLFSINYTGDVQPYLLTVQVLWDGQEVFNNDLAFTGIEYIVEIDNRVVKSGAHHITVIANSQNYTGITENYTYTVDEVNFPDGGVGVGLQDNTGDTMFPMTLASLILMEDGSRLADWYKQVIIEIQNGSSNGFIEMEESIPTASRKENTLYGLIIDDFSK